MASGAAQRYTGQVLDLANNKALRARVVQLLERAAIAVTPQRVEIGAALLARPQHVSAEQVLIAARAGGSKVSKATVYNTLKLFVSKGLVREVNIDPGRLCYDSTTAPHYHFYNVDTGELLDLPHDAVALLRLPEPPPGTVADGIEIVIRLRNRRAVEST